MMKIHIVALSSVTILISAMASPAATISTFTGGNVGEGIDFSGNVTYAGNIGPDTAYTVNGVTFNGFSHANANNALSNWTPLDGFLATDYGATANDDQLELVMNSIGHSSGFPTVEFTSLLANQVYKLQVLAADKSLGRSSSYQLITGSLLLGTTADESLNNDIYTLQGEVNTVGVVITLVGLSDALGQLSFRAIDGTTGSDNNSIASGYILTAVPEPSSTALLGLGGLALLLRRRKG